MSDPTFLLVKVRDWIMFCWGVALAILILRTSTSDTTTFIIIMIFLLSFFPEPPHMKRFRENREREQREPEKYRLT